MKAVCLKKYLKEATGLCEKISGKNLSLPVLSNILISADGDGLKLSATNLELGIEVEIPAKISKKGKVAVPANIIGVFLSNLSMDENITIETQNNNNLLISTENSSTVIKGQPNDDFPILPQNRIQNSYSIPIKDLVSGLKSVYYSCSLSATKPELSSVYMYSQGKKFVFVATDSFRLAEKKIKSGVEKTEQILIPFKTVLEIIRVFDGREGDVKLSADKNQLFLESDGLVLISRLIDGVFPDYQQIIPQKFTSDVVIGKDLLVNVFRTASIFSGKLCEVVLSFKKGDSVVLVKTSNQETGEHLSRVAAKVTGEGLDMNFNYKYISDCLAHISSQEVILRFSGKDRPLLISGVDDISFQYLVMPLNGI